MPVTFTLSLVNYVSFGASPVSEDRYFRVYDDQPQEPVRSIRNSTYGYRNHDNVKVSYASLERYLEDIHRMVENGLLSEEKEFYAPVRLRGGNKCLICLKQVFAISSCVI